MSKEFIEKKCNSLSLDKAVRQKKQLDYFTISDIQEDVNVDYFEKYIERKYYTDDVFLNWVKSIFKTDNFLSLAKYYRNPNPSSKLINTKIKEPLTRVFFSEDSHFKYWINGEYVESPIELNDGFDKDLFKAVLFRYNDIIVHDLEDANEPYREIISIDKVVSIEVDDKKIEKIAYTGMIERDGEDLYGYVYLDDERLSFYNKDLELQYRGRLRELKNLIPVRGGQSDLLKSMKQIAETGNGRQNQIPSAGCGIKWKYDSCI